MNHLSILFFIVFSTSFSIAAPSAVSPVRPADKSFTEMARKFRLYRGGLSQRSSAYMVRRPFAQASWKHVPQVSEQDLQNFFEDVRDHKPLTDRQKRSRRLTWLYPDDGCYARAEMMVAEASRRGNELPAKIFAFGDLWVKTDYAVGGQVSWWYHVAPILRVGTQVYVLDPAMDSHAPLKVEDWLGRMNAQVEVSVCAPHTYDPDSACQGRVADQFVRAQTDASYFLDAEWRRLLDLNRTPEDDLGDLPPWRRAAF